MDLQCSVRLLYTGDVRSGTVITFGNYGANTGVVDVLFLGLKRYECIVHKLSTETTDHDRIIQ